jgi:hypothetical protein
MEGIIMKLVINDREIIDMKIADTPFLRIKGLMFKKEINEGLLIKPCNSIHTFFMRKNIDVLYLDKHGKIIKIVHAMKPWKIGPLILKAKAVIELPENTIKKMNIQLHDKIYLKK